MRSIKTIPKPVAALLVLSLIAAAVYAAVTLGPFQVNVTVKEPLSVSPESMDLSLFAGESTAATFTVTNAATATINGQISATVTAVPDGGSAGDVTLDFQSTQAFASGDTSVVVNVSVDQGAVVGSYTVSVTVTR